MFTISTWNESDKINHYITIVYSSDILEKTEQGGLEVFFSCVIVRQLHRLARFQLVRSQVSLCVETTSVCTLHGSRHKLHNNAASLVSIEILCTESVA